MLRLLDTRQAAAMLRLAPTTLAKLRVSGDGPKWMKFGAKVVYDSDELTRWIATRSRYSSTTEYDLSV